MATRLNLMAGEEFVRKILEGERDFSGIKLEEGFDFNSCEGFDDMQEYLEKQNLNLDYILIDGSEFKFIKARGLYLPFVQGGNVNFKYSDFMDSNFKHAKLWNSDFEKVNFGYCNLWQGEFLRGYFRHANMEHANVGCARFREGDLRDTNLKHARLIHVDCVYTRFGNANLRCTDVAYADFRNADFMNTKLLGVINLEQSLNLGFANFIKTVVSGRERAVIEKALEEREMFVLPS